MNLGDILNEDQIVTDLQATNRWEAIDELIGLLVTRGKIKPEHRDQIAAVVKKRENSMSTGIGFGIGIPTLPPISSMTSSALLDVRAKVCNSTLSTTSRSSW
jgi:mannitol/fructose-specific phosphotransferase system IIA component (Ntr-type)